MPTLEDWLALEHTEETPYMVRLFERKPEWLPTGNIEKEVLVWFDSEIPDRPLYLEYEELTLGWNVAHEHLLDLKYQWPTIDPVDAAIDKIEAVLAGAYVQFYAETPEGQWQSAGFIALEDKDRQRAESEAKGLIVTITQWSGRKIQ